MSESLKPQENACRGLHASLHPRHRLSLSLSGFFPFLEYLLSHLTLQTIKQPFTPTEDCSRRDNLHIWVQSLSDVTEGREIKAL